MVISSIDLKDGHVVQLKNGKELVLQRDDAESLIAQFSVYGEVAVVDLDAALGNVDAKGNTVNTPLLKSLLRMGNVRTGGGIRSVRRARELIALGAEKVIIGSAAWKKTPSPDGSVLDEDFLGELVSAVGKDRIIISVDSIGGKIAVKGWTETVDVTLVEGARQAEKFCGELLFTCVEKEGCMGGTDMDYVRSLREAVSCRVVVAGGVSSVEEIVRLERIHCDVQLGMALYTGAVSLRDAFVGCLDWDKTSGLVPVIAQGVNGQVLMQGFSDRAALEKTFDTMRLTFFSRTRGCLWTKGETSGNFLDVVRLRADCDRDSVLATVIPRGPACHTGAWSCYSTSPDEPSTMGRLYNVIADRFANPRPGSYTATLDAKRVREKVEEEAEELCEADGRGEVIWEAADLIYFVNVLLYKEGVTWKDVYDELDRRHKEK